MADAKLSALVELASAYARSNLLYITDGASKRTTLGNLLKALPGGVNEVSLGITGASLTGSNASSVLDLAATWNTTGTPTGIKFNATDTASAAASLLMDLQVGSASQYLISKGGRAAALGGFASGATLSALDVFLARDAANTLAQRNGTNAQAFNIYRTYTDASNYNRVSHYWTGTDYRIETQRAGTGTFTSTTIVSDSGGSVAIGSNVTISGNSVSITGKPIFSVSALTISAGAIAAARGYHTVDTEAAAATDDLDTISGGQAGQLLIINAANSARTVVAKDGTGNLKLAGDFSLDNAEDTLMLIHNGTNWLEISRSDNGA